MLKECPISRQGLDRNSLPAPAPHDDYPLPLRAQNVSWAASLPVPPGSISGVKNQVKAGFLSRNLLKLDTELFIFEVINNVLGDSIRFRHAFIILGVISHLYVLPGGKILTGPGALD